MLEQFADELNEYYEFFCNAEEYNANIQQILNDEKQISKQQELEALESNRIISKENVRLAKIKYGKLWRQHCYKQDGVVYFTKDNVLLVRYEDDYLPKKYQYLEKEQRDVGTWSDIDDDGNDIKK